MWEKRAGETHEAAGHEEPTAETEEEADRAQPALEKILAKQVLEVVNVMQSGVLPHAVARRYDSSGWHFEKEQELEELVAAHVEVNPNKQHESPEGLVTLGMERCPRGVLGGVLAAASAPQAAPDALQSKTRSQLRAAARAPHAAPVARVKLLANAVYALDDVSDRELTR